MILENSLAGRQVTRQGRSSRLHIIAGLFLSAVFASAILYAARTVFVDGDLISAQQVNDNFAELYTRVTSLETTFDGVTRTDNVIQFSGVNVQIVSGTGHTYDTPNGLGNLIVGYDEPRDTDSVKSGSHNIVVGSFHNYQSYGGFVAGLHNTIAGIYATVTGGLYNQAIYTDDIRNGAYAIVSGGYNNRATGQGSAVSGGYDNRAIGLYSSVSGGWSNTASGIYASVSGGWSDTAFGQCSSVSGGSWNVADGDYASVSGGDHNTASGQYTSASGGYSRTASGMYDWAAGLLWEDQ